MWLIGLMLWGGSLVYFCAFFACFCALFYAFVGHLGETEGGAGPAVLALGCPGFLGMTGSIVRFLGIIIGKGSKGSGSFSWGRNWWDWGEVGA